MDILFYAGSLRPGGGLTVAKIMIEALAKNPSNSITVYTGAQDSSRVLKSIFDNHTNVTEKKFFHRINSEVRYFISKLYFLPKTVLQRKSLLISVNYYIPSFCKQFVYHLNLLSFMRQENDSIFKKLKEVDASLACKMANLNVFESDFLKDTAVEYTGRPIRNPKRLYIGVDPDFFQTHGKTNAYQHNANVLLVSSPQPHKDNHTCVDAIKHLKEHNPNVKWKLTIVGGQSVEQWKELQNYALTNQVQENIEFLGPIDKPNLSKLMHQSLCLISASKIESFCMVALEAMASGCPTIVTDETSMPESVGDAAIIVTSGSSKQFADAILSIYQNESFRNELVSKGTKRSIAFSNDAFTDNLQKLLIHL